MQFKVETQRLEKRRSYLNTDKLIYQTMDRKAMTRRLSKGRKVRQLMIRRWYDYDISPGFQYQEDGYQQYFQPTQQMKWEKQRVEYGIYKLMGKYHNIHKVTNKDKWEMKERYSLKKINHPTNPVLSLENIENIMLRREMSQVFKILKESAPV